MSQRTDQITIEPGYEPVLRQLGIASAGDVFVTPHARVWRSIRERENATIDPPDGSPRLHLKRDKLNLGSAGASAEAAGITRLRANNLPTAQLVAHGRLADGRTFSITEDLAGYEPADRLIRNGVPFDQLAAPVGSLAGRLHGARLFHQDLYLCHFYAKVDGATVDVRLIDLTRILVRPFLAMRWQIKDLAQLVYSTRDLSISPEQMEELFKRYELARGRSLGAFTRRLIAFKASRIASHDLELHRRQPDRDVTLS